MLDFLLYYSLVGFILSIILNIILCALYRPPLQPMEIIACTLLWPTTVATLVSTLNGEQEDIED